MRLKDVDVKEIYQKWMDGTGVFRCFSKSTNFATLKYYPDMDVQEVEPSLNKFQWLLEEIQKVGMSKTLFMIDFPGEEAIEAAFILQNYGSMKPILTFNNIMHPNQLIGTEKYLSNLIFLGTKLVKLEKEPFSYVFVLDACRYGDYSGDDLRRHFNNQYEISDGDMPSAELLREMELQTVVYFQDGGTGSEELAGENPKNGFIKEDMDGYLNYLGENGFSVIKKSGGRIYGR